ncbi:hypothetical protein ADUPG1_011929 [Aduncisulcus paluster]|uniref:Uncharacterized protein n=1 Tax=Aduncisulcus paluster TaxID=2918883 RepID=A0ABQ5JXM0_9EUKA|nr:hypothetical protein ADUPG1_011929 [Aduncisulcus paluster]
MNVSSIEFAHFSAVLDLLSETLLKDPKPDFYISLKNCSGVFSGIAFIIIKLYDDRPVSLPCFAKFVGMDKTNLFTIELAILCAIGWRPHMPRHLLAKYQKRMLSLDWSDSVGWKDFEKYPPHSPKSSSSSQVHNNPNISLINPLFPMNPLVSKKAVPSDLDIDHFRSVRSISPILTVSEAKYIDKSHIEPLPRANSPSTLCHSVLPSSVDRVSISVSESPDQVSAFSPPCISFEGNRPTVSESKPLSSTLPSIHTLSSVHTSKVKGSNDADIPHSAMVVDEGCVQHDADAPPPLVLPVSSCEHSQPHSVDLGAISQSNPSITSFSTPRESLDCDASQQMQMQGTRSVEEMNIIFEECDDERSYDKDTKDNDLRETEVLEAATVVDIPMCSIQKHRSQRSNSVSYFCSTSLSRPSLMDTKEANYLSHSHAQAGHPSSVPLSTLPSRPHSSGTLIERSILDGEDEVLSVSEITETSIKMEHGWWNLRVESDETDELEGSQQTSNSQDHASHDSGSKFRKGNSISNSIPILIVPPQCDFPYSSDTATSISCSNCTQHAVPSLAISSKASEFKLPLLPSMKQLDLSVIEQHRLRTSSGSSSNSHGSSMCGRSKAYSDQGLITMSGMACSPIYSYSPSSTASVRHPSSMRAIDVKVKKSPVEDHLDYEYPSSCSTKIDRSG